MSDKKISQLPAATTPLAGTEVLPIVQSGVTTKVSVANLTSGRFVDMSRLTVDNGTSGYILGPTGEMLIGEDAFAVYIGNGFGVAPAKSMLYGTTATTFHQWAAAGAAQLTLTGTALTIASGNLVIGTSGKGIDFSATAGTGTSELLADYEEGDWTPTVTAGVGSITSYTSSGWYTKVGRQVTLTATVSITNNGTGANNLTIGGLPYSVAATQGGGFARENAATGLMQNLFRASATTFDMYTYDNLYPAVTGSVFYITIIYFN